MKNIVKCYKDFFGYFNALKTHCDMSTFFRSKVGLGIPSAIDKNNRSISDRKELQMKV